MKRVVNGIVYHVASGADIKAISREMDAWAGLAPITWNQPIDEERARKVLTDASFECVVGQGSSHCECRAAGFWDANEPEYFQAYKTAARVARARAVATIATGTLRVMARDLQARVADAEYAADFPRLHADAAEQLAAITAALAAR